MSHIISTAQKMAPHLTKQQLIVLESTTYPGTTQEVLLPELEAGSGLKAKDNFYIAYSPEREDPNNKEYSTATTPKVIGADDPKSLELAVALYSSVTNETVLVSSAKVVHYLIGCD